jgi:TPR repeat protein
MKRLLLIASLFIGSLALNAQSYPSGGGHTPERLKELAAEHQELLQEARTNSTTAYKVAVRYFTGKRVKPNQANGLAYLKHAAGFTNSPNYLAVHDLGVATYWGFGTIKQDKEEGRRLVLKACEGTNITDTNQVQEVLAQALGGTAKPFDPIHQSGRFINYSRLNYKAPSTEDKTVTKPD